MSLSQSIFLIIIVLVWAAAIGIIATTQIIQDRKYEWKLVSLAIGSYLITFSIFIFFISVVIMSSSAIDSILDTRKFL